MGMEELELILRCKKNDFDAFEELISIYESKIYNLCFYILKNKEDAMDASQEVCLKIYKSIAKFKGDSKFSRWIYRVTHNTCLDLVRCSVFYICISKFPDRYHVPSKPRILQKPPHRFPECRHKHSG